jgi:hypothetical protein
MVSFITTKNHIHMYEMYEMEIQLHNDDSSVKITRVV